jgi:hypothetical protein
MATEAALKAVSAILKPKKKGKNLYDIAFRHTDFGVNRIYTRNTLKKYSKDPKNTDSFWYVTKVEEGVRVRKLTEINIILIFYIILIAVFID